MKKQLTYWALILICNYGLTIVFHLLLRPFWFLKFDGVTGIEMALTIAILPFSLVIINYLLTKHFEARRFFFINAIIILTCIIISERLHFFNWADSVGSRTHPDNETLEVEGFEREVGLIVALIGIVLAFVRLYRRKKESFDNSFL